MLIWSPKGREAGGVVASVLFILFFLLPLSVIMMSSLSQ
ncbi:phosphonate ABC transporter permease, partial [Salmonella enterica]